MNEEQLNFETAKYPKQRFNYINTAVKSMKKITFFTTEAAQIKSSVHRVLMFGHYVIWEDPLTTEVQGHTHKIFFPTRSHCSGMLHIGTDLDEVP